MLLPFRPLNLQAAQHVFHLLLHLKNPVFLLLGRHPCRLRCLPSRQLCRMLQCQLLSLLFCRLRLSLPHFSFNFLYPFREPLRLQFRLNSFADL